MVSQLVIQSSLGLDPQHNQSFSGSGVGNNPDELVVNNNDFYFDFDFDFDFDEGSSHFDYPNTEMDYMEMFRESSLDDFWRSD